MDTGKGFVYDRVVILGVDGAGAFFKQADTPNIDRIFSGGATSYDVLTSEPTISAECWGSMLLGVLPAMHRLTNSIVGSRPYDTDSIFPSLFRVVRESRPDAVLASFCNWNPINEGIIENNLVVHKDTAPDGPLTDKICDYLAHNDPTVLFVQFDEVDGAGHANGYGTKKHLGQITVTDGYIGRIYDALDKRGLLASTLFIVTADHGGTPGGSHGGSTDAEKYVFYAALGRTVKKGTIGDMQIRDNAAIALYALGIAQPESWTARVPSGLFEGVDAKERPIYSIKYSLAHRTHTSKPTPDGGAAGALDRSKVAAYLPFDGNADAGDIKTAAHGKIYYTDGYFGSAIRLDDGYITLPGCTMGKDSFSLSFWLKTGGVPGDPSIISNKDRSAAENTGFNLALTSDSIHFNLGNGSDCMELCCVLPLDAQDGWVNVTLAIDREKEKVFFRYDFKAPYVADIPEKLRGVSFDALELNVGQDGTGKYHSGFSASLDELLIYRAAFTENDIAALAAFYG